ncbi:MAG: hypothetical protein WDM81_17115 [Rhizomicrobium sp.]
MGFAYAKTAAAEDLVFVSATFEGTRDDPAAIRARMDKLVTDREASQRSRPAPAVRPSRTRRDKRPGR